MSTLTPSCVDALEHRFELERQPLFQDDVFRKRPRRVLLAEELLQREVRRHFRVLILLCHLDEPRRREIDGLPFSGVDGYWPMRYPFRSPFLTVVAGTITNAWTAIVVVASRLAGPPERQLVGPGPVGRRPAELAGALLHGGPVVGLERVLARRARGVEDHRLAGHDHDRGVAEPERSP